MSKNLYTFAVVGMPAKELLVESCQQVMLENFGKRWQIWSKGISQKNLSLERASELAFHKPHSKAINRLDRQCSRLLSVGTASEVLAFYRVIMDGWNCTHFHLANWLIDRTPSTRAKWFELERTGLLWAVSGDPITRLLPEPSPTEVRKAAARQRPADYSARAFLHALFDALQYREAINGLFILRWQCLGECTIDRNIMDKN